MSGLFGECDTCGAPVREYDDPELGHVIELPDTLNGRVQSFVARWIRPEVREAVTKELQELITWATTRNCR